jgi:predicted RNA-binding protein with PUA-like domain
MAYWLVKSEPGAWSWDDQVRDSVTSWTGVRNHQAALNLKAMKVGDKAFFYHSVDEKRIVGVVEVVKEAYPDATDPSGRFVTVDLKAVKPVPQPVTLADIKADPRMADFGLVRQSRLSVVPVTDEQWAIIAGMGGLK